jgi:hypothetical protein
VGLEVRLCVAGLDIQARARHARSSWSELRGLGRNRCGQGLYSQFTAATQADQRHAASIEAVHTFRVGFDGGGEGGFNDRRLARGGRRSPPFSGFRLDFTQSSHLLDALPSNQLDTFCAFSGLALALIAIAEAAIASNNFAISLYCRHATRRSDQREGSRPLSFANA